METYQVFILVMIAYLLGQWVQKKRKRKPVRNLIKVPLVKILFNPFDSNYQWTKFNPKTRTWHWVRQATETEVDQFGDKIFTEEAGDFILNNANGEVPDNG